MKQLATLRFQSNLPFPEDHLQHFNRIKEWFKLKELGWLKRTRFSATGTAILVIFVALMIVILGVSGASPLVFIPGIVVAFFADNLAFSHAPMRWVIAGFVASALINLTLSIYYIIHIF